MYQPTGFGGGITHSCLACVHIHIGTHFCIDCSQRDVTATPKIYGHLEKDVRTRQPCNVQDSSSRTKDATVATLQCNKE